MKDFYEGVFYHSSGLEELPILLQFVCINCGYEWEQSYIPGATDV